MNPTDLLNRAYEAYEGLSDLRRRRHRYKRYTYGNQWSDPADSRRPTRMTEFDAARADGQTPHTNNLLRQLVKCVIGNFRNSLSSSDSSSSSTPAVDPAVADRNLLTEMDCRMLEEFLISGCAIQRVVNEYRPAGAGVWVDNVSPDNFFVNRFEDARGLDIDLIGMLHSMSLREVKMRFARNNPEVDARIMRAYSEAANSDVISRPLIGRAVGSSFFNTTRGLCRVIEVWTLRPVPLVRCHDRHEMSIFTTSPANRPQIKELNARRSKAGLEGIDTRDTISMRWHCTFFTPGGEILDEYDSPYHHGQHPFIVKFYPMIDGEIHSLVEDLIDQQRCVNSMITLIDQIMRVSAKGVLLFPVDQKVDDFSWGDIARLWSRPNAILPYSPDRTGNREPHQIVSASDHAGAYRMLETQLSLFQQVSGVSEAMQGRLPQTNTSAALFESQLRSSTVALLDLLESFNSFRSARDRVINTI